MTHIQESSSRPQPGPRPPRPIWTGTDEDALGREYSTVKEAAAPDAEAPVAKAEEKPVKGKKRVVGIDVARGFAVIGMIAVHTMPSSYKNGEATWAWLAFSGKSAPLFAMLAGISLAFMTGGRRPHAGIQGRRSRVSIMVRAAVLFILGASVNSLTDPAPENILPYYGLLFLFAVPFTAVRVRYLIMSAIGFAVLGPVVMYLALEYMGADFLHNPSFLDLMDNPGLAFVTLLLTGTYPALIWMSYICLGMALGRMKLAETSVQWGILGSGIALIAVSAVISDLLVWWLPTHDILAAATNSTDVEEMLLNYSVYGGGMGTLPTDHPLWLAVNGPHLNTPFSQSYSAGFALVAVGGLSLLAGRVPKLFHPLAVMGTMTLTLYVAHCVALEPLFTQDFVDITRTQGLIFQVIVAVVFAIVWKKFFTQGPLEKPVSEISKRVAMAVIPGKDADPAAARKDYNPPQFNPELNKV
ncbi:heparan-alpha-glucosaminide N-acetyltransferase domain-containing protein [Corynebacterium sp. H130]|uniref:heparan-alpha-glucosaminide N-acetyltransferase domain-containing protein n=1 Tax=Corynebacterium sp. H130 TaxID=3133444 RepID=UPI00309B10D6